MQLTKFNRYIRAGMQFGINIHINSELIILNVIFNLLFFPIRFINVITAMKLR
jgi:hypothetical protein